MKETLKEIDYKYVDISQIKDAKYIGLPTSFAGKVGNKDSVPYLAYNEILMKCEPDDSTAKCSKCQNAQHGMAKRTLGASSAEVLRFMNLPEEKVNGVLKAATGVPNKCGSASFQRGDSTNIVRGIVDPMIEEVGDRVLDIENLHEIRVPIAFVGNANMVEINKTYMFYGYLHRDPKLGKAVFACEKVKPIADDIRNFKLTDKVKQSLEKFEPEKKDDIESYRDRVRDILHELSVNHHKINSREDCAFWQALTFTSALDYRWGTLGSAGNRGWMEIAIIGDTRTGKSVMADGMMKAFNMGYKIAGDSVTYPGLVGGVQPDPMGTWYVSWGLLPTQDKRLLVMDEMHSSNAIPVIKQLNEIRSSGEAKITKVVQGSTKARVRKIFLANTKEGTTTEDKPFGVENLQDIFSTSEAIARLDMFICPVKSDVLATEVTSVEEMVMPHFQPDLNTLIKFIYSRAGDQVIIHDDVQEYIIEQGERLCKKYDGLKIPLIDSGETHHKVARMCCAMAGLLHIVDDQDNIVPDKTCVDLVVEAIEGNYDSESTGYLSYSQMKNRHSRFKDFEDFFNSCSKLREIFGSGNRELMQEMKDTLYISNKDISETWDISPVQVKQISGVMKRCRLATSYGSKIKKTKRGVQVFKFLLQYKGKGKLINKDMIADYFKRYLV